MFTIHPFKVIIPSETSIEYKIENGLLHLNKSYIDHNKSDSVDRITYLYNAYNDGLLKSHKNESFYCCKISSKDFTTIGLLALVQVDNVGKIIFEHERCIKKKKDLYVELFKQYHMQTAPIILIHRDTRQIAMDLPSLTHNRNSIVSTQDKDYNYDIYEIEDVDHCRRLYKQLSAFIVADGHHRLSSIKEINTNGLVLALLVSESSILSESICRKYFNVSSSSKHKLLSLLKQNFGISRTEECFTVDNPSEYFLFNIDGTTYTIHNSNNLDTRLKILQLLDEEINDVNGCLNFHNYSHKHNAKLLALRTKDVVIFIPKLSISLDSRRIYPPHSTMFYPKIPEGIVSYSVLS